MSLDGLAALTAQREKARTSARRVPPPRHNPKEPTPQQLGTTASDAPPIHEETAPAETNPSSRDGQAPQARPTPVEPLVRSTVYVDAHADQWLEDVAIAGRRARPRVDASRSAVVRLALERLRNTTSPDEVLDQLRTHAAAAPLQAGRRRL